MTNIFRRDFFRWLLLSLLTMVVAFSAVVPVSAAAEEEIAWRRKIRVEDARAPGGLEFEQYYFKELFGSLGIQGHSFAVRIFDSRSVVFNAIKYDRTILRNCPFSFRQFRHLLRIISSAVPLFYQTS